MEENRDANPEAAAHEDERLRKEIAEKRQRRDTLRQELIDLQIKENILTTEGITSPHDISHEK